MNLTSIRLWQYDLPLTRPLAARDGGMRRRGLLVEVGDDAGHAAWGEAAPLPGHGSETLEAAREGLARFAAWCGQVAPAEPIAVEAWLKPLALGPAALCAVESAVFGLIAQRRGQTLQALLWPKPADHVAIAGLIDRGDTPHEAATSAAALAAAGHRAIKLKVGGVPLDVDLARVKAVAEAAGGVPLRLDANRAWSPGDARHAMLEFKRTGVPIDYVEEPVAVGGLLPGAALPQALDETLVETAPANRTQWLERLPDVVVLKPMLLGLSAAWRLAFDAKRAGVAPVISASFETGLGLHLAAALASGTGEVAGLGTSRWFETDLCPAPLGASFTLPARPPVPYPRHIEVLDAVV